MPIAMHRALWIRREIARNPRAMLTPLRGAAIFVLLVASTGRSDERNLTQLKTIYRSTKSKIEESHHAVVEKALEHYRLSLKATRGQLEHAGNFNGVLAAKAEQERMKTSDALPASLPPELAAAVPAARRAKKVIGQADRKRDSDLLRLTQRYERSLRKLMSDLLPRKRIEEAADVQEEIDRIAAVMSFVRHDISHQTETQGTSGKAQGRREGHQRDHRLVLKVKSSMSRETKDTIDESAQVAYPKYRKQSIRTTALNISVWNASDRADKATVYWLFFTKPVGDGDAQVSESGGKEVRFPPGRTHSFTVRSKGAVVQEHPFFSNIPKKAGETPAGHAVIIEAEGQRLRTVVSSRSLESMVSAFNTGSIRVQPAPAQ